MCTSFSPCHFLNNFLQCNEIYVLLVTVSKQARGHLECASSVRIHMGLEKRLSGSVVLVLRVSDTISSDGVR